MRLQPTLPIVCGLLLLTSCGSQDSVVDEQTTDNTSTLIADTLSEQAGDAPSGETDAVEPKQPTENSTESETKIAIGQKAASFRLKDQNGQEHALADLTKEGKLALVFFRSADW